MIRIIMLGVIVVVIIWAVVSTEKDYKMIEEFVATHKVTSKEQAKVLYLKCLCDKDIMEVNKIIKGTGYEEIVTEADEIEWHREYTKHLIYCYSRTRRRNRDKRMVEIIKIHATYFKDDKKIMKMCKKVGIEIE